MLGMATVFFCVMWCSIPDFDDQFSIKAELKYRFIVGLLGIFALIVSFVVMNRNGITRTLFLDTVEIGLTLFSVWLSTIWSLMVNGLQVVPLCCQRAVIARRRRRSTVGGSAVKMSMSNNRDGNLSVLSMSGVQASDRSQHSKGSSGTRTVSGVSVVGSSSIMSPRSMTPRSKVTQEQKQPVTLADILQHYRTFNALMDHLVKEFSTENLLCITEFMQFKVWHFEQNMAQLLVFGVQVQLPLHNPKVPQSALVNRTDLTVIDKVQALVWKYVVTGADLEGMYICINLNTHKKQTIDRLCVCVYVK